MAFPKIPPIGRLTILGLSVSGSAVLALLAYNSWDFVWPLLEEAARRSWQLKTSVFSWAGILAIPSSLWIKYRREGWAAMRTHLTKHLFESLIPAAMAVAVIFAYQLFVAVPNRINKESRRTPSFLPPAVASVPTWALIPPIKRNPPPQLVATLDYVAGGCIAREPYERSSPAKVILIYVVTLSAKDGGIKIDPSSLRCSATTDFGSEHRQWPGITTSDIYGLALYEMGGAESIDAKDWLDEAAFSGPIDKDHSVRKRVGCLIPSSGNPQQLFIGTTYNVSFKDQFGRNYPLVGKFAEPPFAMRVRNSVVPGVDRRYLGLSMDAFPARLTDVKPTLLINFASRLSSDGATVPGAISRNVPVPFSANYGFSLCSYH